jgi:hypothetical protein
MRLRRAVALGTLALILLAAPAWPGPPGGAAQDAPGDGAAAAAVVRAAVAARNAYDLVGVVGRYAEGADVGGRSASCGPPGTRAQLRQVFGTTFAEGRPVEVVDLQAAGDRASAHLREDRTWYRAVGLPPSEHAAEVTVRDGLIVRWHADPLPATAAMVPTYLAGLTQASVVAAQATGTAIQPTLAARATQLAASDRATRVAASGLLARLPDTQGRGTPAAGRWLVAPGVCLAGVVLLALLKRPGGVP